VTAFCWSHPSLGADRYLPLRPWFPAGSGGSVFRGQDSACRGLNYFILGYHGSGDAHGLLRGFLS
jgi:hypothetical protein